MKFIELLNICSFIKPSTNAACAMLDMSIKIFVGNMKIGTLQELCTMDTSTFTAPIETYKDYQVKSFDKKSDWDEENYHSQWYEIHLVGPENNEE